MKLKIIQQDARPADPWYAGGLNFTCTQCGNCCTGGPGFVWVTREEIVRVAEHLGITPEEMVERYCRKVDGQFSFKERVMPDGGHDCVFLTTEAVRKRPPAGAGGDEQVVYRRRGCSIYSVRPLQCRTW